MKRILLVTESVTDIDPAQLAQAESNSNCRIEHTAHLDQAQRLLNTADTELVIADLKQVQADDCLLLRSASWIGVPVVILVACKSEARLFRAMRNPLFCAALKPDWIANLQHIARRALRKRDLADLRKNRAQLLSEQQRRFQTFAELAADWFWETNSEVLMSLISEGFSQFSRVDPATLYGLPLREAMRSCGSNYDWHMIDVVTRRRREFELEFLPQQAEKAGDKIFVRAVPFFGDDGKFNGFRGIVRCGEHAR